MAISPQPSIWHECCLPVINRRGLHARAATKFARVAEAYRCAIEVACRPDKGEGSVDEWVDGKSILGLMMLAACQGTMLIIRTHGHDSESNDSEQALAALAELTRNGFNED